MEKMSLNPTNNAIVLNLGDGTTGFRIGTDEGHKSQVQLVTLSSTFSENTVTPEDFEGSVPFFELNFHDLRSLNSMIAVLTALKERVLSRSIEESLIRAIELDETQS